MTTVPVITEVPSRLLPSLPTRFALGSIRLYQRYISPYKGFCCACAALHGGESCSAAIARIIAEQGVWDGRQQVAAQFERCREAYRVLQTGSFGGGGSGNNGGTGGSIGGRSTKPQPAPRVAPRGDPRRGAPLGQARGRPSGGGVQGVFCCGPVPIPFRCG